MERGALQVFGASPALSSDRAKWKADIPAGVLESEEDLGIADVVAGADRDERGYVVEVHGLERREGERRQSLTQRRKAAKTQRGNDRNERSKGGVVLDVDLRSARQPTFRWR